MKNLTVKCLVVSPCQTNCYYFYKEGSEEAVVVDPGDRGNDIYAKLASEGLSVAGILITHGHFDHMMGAEDLRDFSGAKIYAYEKEQEILEDSYKNLTQKWGIGNYTLKPDEYVKAGAVLEMGGFSIKVLPTPGHTIGGCSFYLEEQEACFCGDTVFQLSIGRCDLPTGSQSQLIRGVQEQILPLPDETTLFPGHGDTTTVGFERVHNPFFGSYEG